MPTEWQVATRKRRSRKAPENVQPQLYSSQIVDSDLGSPWLACHVDNEAFCPNIASSHTHAQLAGLMQKVKVCLKDVQVSSFLHKFQRLWKYVGTQSLPVESLDRRCEGSFTTASATELVIYGLGSPAGGYRAVHCQLAFALFLQTQLPSLEQTCAFDPVFTVLDKSLLNEYQIKVSEQDISGRYLAITPTLFYMPHCDCHLYNNLLKANWGPHQLRKIAILGIATIPPLLTFSTGLGCP
ncbi:TPA: sensitivity to red-light reduced protein, variant 2 [Trebouxia sp. C0004]